jgi:hypothetical protein
MEKCPQFDLAVTQFKEFLATEGKPTEILWVFREDVTSFKRMLWFKAPIRHENESSARILYAQGLERGLGVNLHQIGEYANNSLCYIWIPADEVDMSQAMMGNGLKLSILQSSFDLRPVPGNLNWKWLKWRNQQRGYNSIEKQLPERIPILAQPSPRPYDSPAAGSPSGQA